MNFKIIESLVVGKYIDESICEDRIVITDNFACVIDGATSKSAMTLDGKTQGVIAGELIEKVLKVIVPTISINELITTINEEFINYYKNKGLYSHMEQNPVDRLNASIAIYSHCRNAVWLIGDCQVMIGTKHYTNVKLIDTVLSNLRSFIIENTLYNGYTIEKIIENDIGRDGIMSFLKEQPQFQNQRFDSDFSYGVLDGFPINFKHVKEFQVNDNAIVLASDGYPQLFSTLLKSEKYLFDILKKDPLCYKIFKTTKGLSRNKVSYDDRAYIKIVDKPLP